MRIEKVPDSSREARVTVDCAHRDWVLVGDAEEMGLSRGDHTQTVTTFLSCELMMVVKCSLLMKHRLFPPFSGPLCFSSVPCVGRSSWCSC